ncbi:Histone_H3 [Hexamita inflata]|uniref:Histone H3 n=1 Tax=Hexamita inflata TaxID=28002 RepID=A0AA86NDV5_9EUKA|nr:Histone H3 [Hexamita inflata]CAI9937731.1 Histone H3 [Hexamita inflata]CAI9975248.1 Histone H3 [Hexamita inflata]
MGRAKVRVRVHAPIESKKVQVSKKSVVTKKINRRSAAEPRKVRPKRKSGPSSFANLEIKMQQKSSQNCIPKACFVRVVKEISSGYGLDYRFSKQALDVLQEAAEQLAVTLLGDAVILAQHARRITIMDIDLKVHARVTRPLWAVDQ